MSNVVHSISFISGSKQSAADKLHVGLLYGIPNLAGAGAGLSVTTAVAFAPNANMPANYAVVVENSNDLTYVIGAKTATGFNVILYPRLAANTVPSGSFNVAVFA